jgi:eukaryotic-like serine/threonine-protein kinase
MTSAIGTRVGPYEIVSALGAGGMGEVYRARDPRLGRDVALKVIKRDFIGNSSHRARFEREARALASLNHPNIATIHGIEETGGLPAIVMELVEGPTLADRILKGPLALHDTLAIARSMADALDAAHEKGIIHRDLKPSNVKLTSRGAPKVLDFGLAKALALDGGDTEFGQAPTMTVGATGEGTVLGTPAYMSPEQARGQTVDKRTDIWAFGCVVYEMLAGRAAFARSTTSDTIASVLGHEPDWSQLPATAPPSIRHLLQRCLEKDPRRRLHDIADARIEIDDVLTGEPPAQNVAASSLLQQYS